MKIFVAAVIAACSLGSFAKAPAVKDQIAKSASFTPVFYKAETKITAYQVNDAKKVFDWVQSQIALVPGTPDQFSSTEDKQKYRVTLQERMAAIGPIPMPGPCVQKYDADSKTFEVKSALPPLKRYAIDGLGPGATWQRKLLLATTRIDRSKYKAQNSFGASVEVSKTSSDQYAFVFTQGNEPDQLVVSDSSYEGLVVAHLDRKSFLQLNVEMAPTDARKNADQMECLFVVSLEAPYTFSYEEKLSPTRDIPIDIEVSGRAMFGKLERMVVFNKTTGEVFTQASR
jgi:hypothetical protein